MLPLHQAIEVRESIWAYLRATFGFRERSVREAFEKFVRHPQEGIFKGPYLSIRLPFVRANQTDEVPLTIRPAFPPYDHQLRAFRRLAVSNDHRPEPTLLTTGTGSGKTESFLFPIVDYCYQQRHRPGIKAIILYPMNALATDQAGRLAKLIHDDERLRGNLTAGLFIGEGARTKGKQALPTMMGPINVIENRNAILDSPPDILLTNFKMLDMGLMRDSYARLWDNNEADPSLLKFLVLDELHTYDGAQGTDVANLIRRLRLRLDLPGDQICPVGTSATIGTGDEAPRLLADYASKLFGVPFDANAIITERRQTLTEFFGTTVPDNSLPRASKLQEADFRIEDTPEKYLQRQASLWQVDENFLGEELRKLRLVRDLISVSYEGTPLLDDVCREMTARNVGFAELSSAQQQSVIISLVALLSAAKQPENPQFPLVYIQVQQWIRALSGVLRVFSDVPTFRWSTADVRGTASLAMPPYFCRECGASGWLAVKHDNKERFESDVADVYQKYFSFSKHIFLVNTAIEDHESVADYQPTDRLDRYVSRQSGEFFSEADNENRIRLLALRKLSDNGYFENSCPECGNRHSLSLIGTGVATMSSVTVSQVLSTDLESQPDRQRKVLAFTNQVQDAAHQAGFIEARNYRFTFRTSLQRVINLANGPVTVSDLASQFKTYWKQHTDSNEPLAAYYYRFFPTDYIGRADLNDYREHGQSGKFQTKFQAEFDQRVDWEITTELGYNALIGRTLEKTGSAGVFILEEPLRRTFARLQPWLVANQMERIEEDTFIRFTNALLHRTRTRGGLSHPYLRKYRSKKFDRWDLNWRKDGHHFLNPYYGFNTRRPQLLSPQANTFEGVDSTAARSGNNYFHAYFRKTFLNAPNHFAAVNEFYEQLLACLKEDELLDSIESEDKRTVSFALRPDRIWVEKAVRQHTCSRCGHTVITGAGDTMLPGSRCLTFRCAGQYEPQPKANESSYYQFVYNRNRSPRIHATEHTGLLERQVRERIERDFRDRPRFDSLNALVATSTLEMGIDIGTLNVVLNHNMPPQPANFLQRIGRAGRQSGSALVLNFIPNKAHDLYYFTAPAEMMTGAISTPGCFLEARAILKRHFTAYCLDSWTATDPKTNQIPALVRFLGLLSGGHQQPAFWGNRFLSFVKVHEAWLYDRFAAVYQTDVSQSTLLELQDYLQTDGFYDDFRTAFRRLADEMRDLRAKRVHIFDFIKTKGLGQQDPQRKLLEGEARTLNRRMRTIEGRQVLEHLTNVGVLPNYAFPETGVELSARILGAESAESGKAPREHELSIIRPAGQALRELAPGSHFYIQGYRLPIRGISTYDWSDPSVFRKLRFCSQCDYLTEADTSVSGPCPKCGHASFQDVSNSHTFVQLTSVRSVDTEANATATDTRDDRDPERYLLSRHFTFPSTGVQGAYAMRQIPFGIEFVRNVSLTDVNLGGQRVVHSRHLTIKGRERVPVHGFVTCRSCGKATSTQVQDQNYEWHFPYCPQRQQAYNGHADSLFEEVYLSRTMPTEALKIVLPVQEIDSEATLAMFEAGFMLGLKHYYRGNPDHLSLTDYAEYNARTQRFDQYLVLFDTIPGGTGYLEKLFNPEAFMQVLRLAYEAISECTCQYHGADGCYHCVYSYSNQYKRQGISRRQAEILFGRIVNSAATWDRLSSGLGAVTATGQIEESELENRFIRSLRSHFGRDNFVQDSENGVECYRFVVTAGTTKFSYFVRPQVELGPADGVSILTRTDFLLTCTRAEVNGLKLSESERLAIPQIAVYLDGYQYHATADKPRFLNDIQKRQALLSSGRYQVWILTWDDLELFDQAEEITSLPTSLHKLDGLARRLKQLGFLQTTTTIIKQATGKQLPPVWDARNNLERLLKLLAWPIADTHRQRAWASLAACYQPTIFRPSFDGHKADQLVQFTFPIPENEVYIKSQAQVADGYVWAQIWPDNDLFASRLFINLNGDNNRIGFQIHPQVGDFPRTDWQAFWWVYNILQFVGLPLLVNRREAHQPITPLPQIQSRIEVEDTLNDTLMYYDEPYHPLLKELINQGIPFGSDGSYLLIGKLGEQLAESILGFGQARIVIDPLSPADAHAFQEAGYQVIQLADFTVKAIFPTPKNTVE